LAAAQLFTAGLFCGELLAAPLASG